MAIKCDRCHICFDPNDENSYFISFINPSVRGRAENKPPTCFRFYENMDPDERIDLCPACSEYFTNFMSNWTLLETMFRKKNTAVNEKDGV